MPPSHVFFFRSLISPQITWSIPGLSLVNLPSPPKKTPPHPHPSPPPHLFTWLVHPTRPPRLATPLVHPTRPLNSWSLKSKGLFRFCTPRLSTLWRCLTRGCIPDAHLIFLFFFICLDAAGLFNWYRCFYWESWCLPYAGFLLNDF